MKPLVFLLTSKLKDGQLALRGETLLGFYRIIGKRSLISPLQLQSEYLCVAFVSIWATTEP